MVILSPILAPGLPHVGESGADTDAPRLLTETTAPFGEETGSVDIPSEHTGPGGRVESAHAEEAGERIGEQERSNPRESDGEHSDGTREASGEHSEGSDRQEHSEGR